MFELLFERHIARCIAFVVQIAFQMINGFYTYKSAMFYLYFFEFHFSRLVFFGRDFFLCIIFSFGNKVGGVKIVDRDIADIDLSGYNG